MAPESPWRHSRGRFNGSGELRGRISAQELSLGLSGGAVSSRSETFDPRYRSNSLVDHLFRIVNTSFGTSGSSDMETFSRPFVMSKLAWRISGAYMALIVAVLIGLALYVAAFTRSTYIEQLETQLAAEAAVLGGEAAWALQDDPAADLQPLATRVGAHSQARVTLIALDGRVLGDSAELPELMENHADRPEVIDAAAGQRGVSLRRERHARL